MIGDFEKSKKILRNLHNEFPQNVHADQLYSSIHKYDDDQTHQKEMLEKLNNENISSNEKLESKPLPTFPSTPACPNWS